MKVAENVYTIHYNADRTAYASDLAEIEEAINAEEKKSGRPYYLCGEVYEPGINNEWEYAGHYSCDSNLSPNVCYKGFEGVVYVIIGNYSTDEALEMIDAAEKQNEKKEETKMKKIQNGYDWNEFVCACRENVEERGVFGVSQDGEKIDSYFIVKKNCGYLGFYNSKTGKKAANELGDDSRGYLEQLAGPVGKFSFPFYLCDVEGKDREYIQRRTEPF